MTRPNNKYERRQAGRRRLERLYDNGGNDYCPQQVTFILNNKDEGDERYAMFSDCLSCLYRTINIDGKYLTWERPTGIDYTIVRTRRGKHNGQTSRTRYYKRYSNKKVRKTNITYKRNQYKKVFDYWWTLY